MRRTKIVCTIGPASGHIPVLMNMIEAGLNVARLNFSHGTHEQHAQYIAAIRKASLETGKHVAIMLDTKGPEIRLGYLKEKSIVLKAGQKVLLTTQELKGTADTLPVTYQGLPQDVVPGNRILISDGLIALRVLKTNDDSVECVVENGGEITSQKGINLPGVTVHLPAVTDQDKEDIIFGVEQELDFIAASFVRKAADILEIRKTVESAKGQMDIIAKIENQEALNNIDDIIKVSDGIMVARGDLGVEIPVEDIPLMQKMIIKKCNLAGKPVITATQMLESMIHNPRPTRAEASDVANAIFDQTDAIMLSGETAAGKYPLESVMTMSRIAEKAESALDKNKFFVAQRNPMAHTVTDAISHATCTIAHDLGASSIITSTETGHTARMVSKYRPLFPIVAVTPSVKVIRKMALVWGVYPLQTKPSKDTDSMISSAIDVSLREKMIAPGDLVVVTAGVPAGVHGTTNLIKVHIVGDILAKGIGITPKSSSGVMRICLSAQEAAEKIKKGDILVTRSIDKDFVPILEQAGGLITEVGGLTSHGAIVGLELGIPTVVGIESATSLLQDGEMVTVDGQRGLVYKGTAKVL